MSCYVVDTNVAVTANGKADHASDDCRSAAIDALLRVRNGKIAMDDADLILSEYRHYRSPKGQPGVGDQFMRWLVQNQANPLRCEKVAITPLEGPPWFEEFPDDPDLAGFDRSDRMFAAVALSNPSSPPVVNAVDRDWWEFREALERNGVVIEFLCPDEMERRAP